MSGPLPQLRPDARAFLDLFNATALAHLERLEPVEARRLKELARTARHAQPNKLAVVRDIEIGCPALRMRFYDAQLRRGPGPLIVYYHGGGFVLGDLESHHDLCAAIAEGSDLPLLAVEYRLAPEHPWPAGPDDAEAAARWAAHSAGAAFCRNITALVLAGDSAGANLAAVTSMALRDQPATVAVSAQVLMYPCTSSDEATPSRTQFCENHLLTRDSLEWFYGHYKAPKGDPRGDLFAGELAMMPPTVLVTAELDPLRDEGRRYAQALIGRGVAVNYREVAGNIHGCFSLLEAIPSTSPDLRRVLDALLHTLGRE